MFISMCIYVPIIIIIIQIEPEADLFRSIRIPQIQSQIPWIECHHLVGESSSISEEQSLRRTRKHYFDVRNLSYVVLPMTSVCVIITKYFWIETQCYFGRY